MSGMIEAWGRGFDKIKEACARYEGPLPEYDIKKSGIMVLCKACDRYLDLLHDKSHPVQSEQDVKMIFRKKSKSLHTCSKFRKDENVYDRTSMEGTFKVVFRQWIAKVD